MAYSWAKRSGANHAPRLVLPYVRPQRDTLGQAEAEARSLRAICEAFRGGSFPRRNQKFPRF
jgi:hypothetical protein